MRAGAVGFLRKTAPIGDVVRAIRGAARGEVQFSATDAVLLVREMQSPSAPEQLTSREREVLQLIAEGLANKEIAWKLRIAEKTVKSHVSTILGKLGLQSRTQAAMYASRLGLVRTEPPRLGASIEAAGSVRCARGRAAARRETTHAQATRPCPAPDTQAQSIKQTARRLGMSPGYLEQAVTPGTGAFVADQPFKVR